MFESAALILSIRSFSSLSFASLALASSRIRWISCSVRPDEASMRIFCSLPVPLSLADTFRMPLASISKATSICGTPRGAAGIPSRWKRPIDLLSRASGRSPWQTLISTEGWLSAAVEKTSLFRVGIVVLASISLVITPPRVSIPSDSGVTSSSSTSFTSPVRTPPWIAAPMATTSSGFTPLLGTLPKKFSTTFWIAGIRGEPPTRSPRRSAWHRDRHRAGPPCKARWSCGSSDRTTVRIWHA